MICSELYLSYMFYTKINKYCSLISAEILDSLLCFSITSYCLMMYKTLSWTKCWFLSMFFEYVFQSSYKLRQYLGLVRAIISIKFLRGKEVKFFYKMKWDEMKHQRKPVNVITANAIRLYDLGLDSSMLYFYQLCTYRFTLILLV